jgi:GntR family transcriptional regulator
MPVDEPSGSKYTLSIVYCVPRYTIDRSEVNVVWLDINPRASDPLYLQIIRSVKLAVAREWLTPGEKLPSVRELATELTINHNTVAKAYQELEREHVIEVIVGRGTFISINPQPPNRVERIQEMQNAIQTWLIEAHHLGMTAEQFLDTVQQTVAEWTEAKEVEDDGKNH